MWLLVNLYLSPSYIFGKKVPSLENSQGLVYTPKLFVFVNLILNDEAVKVLPSRKTARYLNWMNLQRVSQRNE